MTWKGFLVQWILLHSKVSISKVFKIQPECLSVVNALFTHWTKTVYFLPLWDAKCFWHASYCMQRCTEQLDHSTFSFSAVDVRLFRPDRFNCMCLPSLWSFCTYILSFMLQCGDLLRQERKQFPIVCDSVKSQLFFGVMLYRIIDIFLFLCCCVFFARSLDRHGNPFELYS